MQNNTITWIVFECVQQRFQDAAEMVTFMVPHIGCCCGAGACPIEGAPVACSIHHMMYNLRQEFLQVPLYALEH